MPCGTLQFHFCKQSGVHSVAACLSGGWRNLRKAKSTGAEDFCLKGGDVRKGVPFWAFSVYSSRFRAKFEYLISTGAGGNS